VRSKEMLSDELPMRFGQMHFGIEPGVISRGPPRDKMQADPRLPSTRADSSDDSTRSSDMPFQVMKEFPKTQQPEDTQLLDPPAPVKRIAKKMMKTRYCKHFLRGYCRYDSKCAYAHQVAELKPKPDLAKTRICLRFLSGECNNEACAYAHGLQEMRKVNHQEWHAQNGGHPAHISASPGMDQLQQYTTAMPLQKEGDLPFAGFVASLLSQLPPEAQQEAYQAAWHAAQEAAEHAAHEFLQQQQDPYPNPQPQRQDDGAWLDLQIQRGQSAHQSQLYDYESDRVSDRVLSRWKHLSVTAMKYKRMSCIAQYKWLCMREHNCQVSQAEEYEIVHLFLRDPKWVPLFPNLAKRCTARLSQHLRELWEGSAT